MSRFSEPAPAQWTDAQRRVAEAITAGPRGSLRGPFLPLLHSPGLAEHVQKVGEYLRYQSALPAALKEFAILICARFWTAQYEWYAHHKLALEAGLDPAIGAQLAEGVRPDAMSPEQTVVYDFCTELHRGHAVSDPTFQAAVAKLGEPAVVDIIGICGYYTLISMVLNVAQVGLPAGAPLGLAPLPG